MSDLPWEIRVSRSKGLPYFFNRDTQESLWEPPAGLSQAEIDSLPGAEQLQSQAPPSSKGSAAAVSKQSGDGRVRASHLLVKHAKSRRPASWKEKNITRSKEAAIQVLRGFQAEIGGDPEKFGALAKVHSDCSSHDHNGDLGWFGPGMMQKKFEDATYALEIGQISDIIETDSGVHLILRTA